MQSKLDCMMGGSVSRSRASSSILTQRNVVRPRDGSKIGSCLTIPADNELVKPYTPQRLTAGVMPPPPPPRTTPVLLPLVLRTIGPVLDARSLAWALASSTGTWSDRATVAATSSIVANLSLDSWKVLAASIGAARLLRVLRALRDAVGFAGLQELNKQPIAKSLPAHVSATLWLMSL